MFIFTKGGVCMKIINTHICTLICQDVFLILDNVVLFFFGGGYGHKFWTVHGPDMVKMNSKANHCIFRALFCYKFPDRSSNWLRSETNRLFSMMHESIWYLMYISMDTLILNIWICKEILGINSLKADTITLVMGKLKID